MLGTTLVGWEVRLPHDEVFHSDTSTDLIPESRSVKSSHHTVMEVLVDV
jgi:hypothetical protein